jgi:MFS family permease
VLSDRTRSRLGRRRPFLIGGLVLGMVALVVMAVAPSIPVLGVGWVLAVLGWGNVMNGITYLQADKLPAAQRGRVSGYTGFAQMLAAVLGVGVATVLVGNNFLLLLGPAVLGTVLLVPLLIWTYDPDSRAAVAPERLGVRRMVGKYVFDPRRHPDFSWNWLGRLLFYIGLTFNTTFVTFLLAQRLDVSVDKVGGVAALVAGVGVVGTTIGAIGGGVASDRLGRRRIFVLASGAVFCLGAVTMALSASLAILIVGSTVTNLGVGMFSAVDQAVLLDVLPSRAEAGRYLGIMTYAQEIPRALAPLAAAPLLAIGAVGASKNYTVLYLVGGVVTLLGGLIIMQRVKGSR